MGAPIVGEGAGMLRSAAMRVELSGFVTTGARAPAGKSRQKSCPPARRASSPSYTAATSMRSLPNYLNRIGLKHAPLKADLSTLALVMAAHSRAIAFENIDVVRGKTISMARGDVEKKLVDDLRGGYCWEQNTLLSMALEEIGFDVVPLLCRVRWNKVAAQRALPDIGEM